MPALGSGGDELPQVGHRAEVGVDGGVAPSGAADRPGAAGVVGPARQVVRCPCGRDARWGGSAGGRGRRSPCRRRRGAGRRRRAGCRGGRRRVGPPSTVERGNSSYHALNRASAGSTVALRTGPAATGDRSAQRHMAAVTSTSFRTARASPSRSSAAAAARRRRSAPPASRGGCVDQQRSLLAFDRDVDAGGQLLHRALAPRAVGVAPRLEPVLEDPEPVRVDLGLPAVVDERLHRQLGPRRGPAGPVAQRRGHPVVAVAEHVGGHHERGTDRSLRRSRLGGGLDVADHRPRRAVGGEWGHPARDAAGVIRATRTHRRVRSHRRIVARRHRRGAGEAVRRRPARA